jgi:hypothetical protein
MVENVVLNMVIDMVRNNHISDQIINHTCDHKKLRQKRPSEFLLFSHIVINRYDYVFLVNLFF